MSTRGLSNTVKPGNLLLANGTLAKPAIRFWKEPKTGFARLAAGAISHVVNGFRAHDVTEFDTFVRSNSAGAGNVAPLGMSRANATTADGQETQFTVYEGAVKVGSLSAYRQTATKYGWKLYGSTSAVLSATADLTADADGYVTARTALLAPRLTIDAGAAATAATFAGTGASMSIDTGAAPNLRDAFWSNGANAASRELWANAGTQKAILGIQGSASAAFLGTALGDVSLYSTVGALILGSAGVERLKLDATGAFTLTGDVTVVGNLVAPTATVTVGVGASATSLSVNRSTVSNDTYETRIDFLEAGNTRARIAAYRQNAAQIGFKFYGSTVGTLNAADLTIDGTGSVSVRGSLYAATGLTSGGAIGGSSLSVNTAVISTSLSGAAISGTSLTITGGGAITGGSLNVTGTIQGAGISGTTGTFSGALSAAGITGTSLTVSGATILASTSGGVNIGGATGAVTGGLKVASNIETAGSLIGFDISLSGGAWATATGLTVTQGAATPTSTAAWAKYRKVGKTVTLTVSMAITGGVGSAGNEIRVNLPAALQSAALTSPLVPVGTFNFLDAGSAVYQGTAYFSTTSAVIGRYGTDIMGAAGPTSVALATSDQISFTITYECA